MSKALDAQKEKENRGLGLNMWAAGGVLWRRLFSLHTLGTLHTFNSRQSDVSSLRDVCFRCDVCGSQKTAFIQNIVRSELSSADRSLTKGLLKEDSRTQTDECLLEGDSDRKSTLCFN